MHAAYTYDAKSGEDFVTLYPDPMRKDLATKINISSGMPNYRCTLQVSDRCLVALDHIEYPREAKKQWRVRKCDFARNDRARRHAE
jgi:hypothetical protein